MYPKWIVYFMENPMENPIYKWDDLGVPPMTLETSRSQNVLKRAAALF